MTTKTQIPFSFSLLKQDGAARRGCITCARGQIQTPAFMPVGTAANVKAMYMEQIEELGAEIILGNTYHLMLRPGAEAVARLGGLHNFSGWKKPILTDSGGFQVMSLAGLRRLDEKGVTFRSHIDGRPYSLTPERAVEIQSLLGSDIQMQLDQCISLPASVVEIEAAMELSLRWAQRCKTAFGEQKEKALFGIVQGGDNEKLREISALALKEMDLKGYAIGGLAVGEPQEVMLHILDVTCALLPIEKPRYLMGVGTPDDILQAIGRGVDMFDCVMPTRAGRHGLAFTKYGKINLRNARHKEDPRPLDADSSCPAASQYSRAYLHHLVKCNEVLASMLLSWNNLHYYQELVRGARLAIEQQNFAAYVAATKEAWHKGDIPLFIGNEVG